MNSYWFDGDETEFAEHLPNTYTTTEESGLGTANIFRFASRQYPQQGDIVWIANSLTTNEQVPFFMRTAPPFIRTDSPFYLAEMQRVAWNPNRVQPRHASGRAYEVKLYRRSFRHYDDELFLYSERGGGTSQVNLNAVISVDPGTELLYKIMIQSETPIRTVLEHDEPLELVSPRSRRRMIQRYMERTGELDEDEEDEGQEEQQQHVTELYDQLQRRGHDVEPPQMDEVTERQDDGPYQTIETRVTDDEPDEDDHEPITMDGRFTLDDDGQIVED